MILGLILLFLVPGEALWRTLRKKPVRPRTTRYRLTIARALALLLGLVVVSHAEHVTAAALGIGTHLESGGYIGLVISLCLVGGLTLSTMLAKPKIQGGDRRQAADIFPENFQELTLFLVMTPLIGFAWELLYRGYLLWWLTPLVGLPIAIFCSGLAYGLAHGWKNFRESFPSIVAAFLFAIGYALTSSLWWLIIIHIALPIIGYLAARRIAATQDEATMV
ncbi:CAAX protease self-immunity [Novosphingobium sp. CF614]|uniref:CPBP family intramembrane glutamic endopeptidase n=1 Tax=Novosphingobium sp. CF614 TaxID=1884364 RepID=UPI0008ED4369|nr:CPBP family intramembrane glutamic endopeptidase [Novosphingobium sp. CF614]SFG28019.1 CAAX protease self-immunity [Novosphingobium sp. CF614]